MAAENFSIAILRTRCLRCFDLIFLKFPKSICHWGKVARVRAKRTEWRMRGIEPNKNVTSFSPHPSCLRGASAIHLPARSIAASPLWLKTVTCGLFLRCFTPPRRDPMGGRLNRLRTLLSFRGVSREIPRVRNEKTIHD